MKEIRKFCENTLLTTEQEKLKVEALLHRETDTETYSDVKKAINTNTLQTKMACQKRKSRKYKSYADALKQSPDIASNHSRPMSFIDHLRKGQRLQTSRNQKDKTTTEPGTIRILQRPKWKTDKPDPAPSLEPLATERI